ncbi:MAG TPA: metal-sensitive transcriptional regulator [Gemmatimonadaceae bacterium]|nr:metal-sensitive transcriptional regulator [Gemmatimonadaceae bacterium]
MTMGKATDKGMTMGTAKAAKRATAKTRTDERDQERHAVAVDPDIKARNLKRLKRIEGQVRGLHRMVEGERYCADILTQISSVHEALRAVGRELMRNHLRHCAARAIRQDGEAAEAMYEEIVTLMARDMG